MKKNTSPSDPAIIAEAAEWLVEMQEGSLSAEKQQQFKAWKNQGLEYQYAWQQAEQLQQYLDNLPDKISEDIFDDRPYKHLGQNFILIFLLTGSLIATVYYTKQNAWLADQRTAYGEQRTIILDDGSKIILNSKTALDVDYSATARNITLHYGEIFIETAKDQPHHSRPFKVLNQHGTVLALGTQFNVAQQEQHTSVAVLEHAVLIENTAGQIYKLTSGQQVQFGNRHIEQASPINTLDFAWHNHLIVTDRMPLSELARNIQKHYGITVELDEAIQDLIISGTYPSNDLPTLIKTLSQAYQLDITQQTFPKKLILYKK